MLFRNKPNIRFIKINKRAKKIYEYKFILKRRMYCPFCLQTNVFTSTVLNSQCCCHTVNQRPRLFLEPVKKYFLRHFCTSVWTFSKESGRSQPKSKQFEKIFLFLFGHFPMAKVKKLLGFFLL